MGLVSPGYKVLRLILDIFSSLKFSFQYVLGSHLEFLPGEGTQSDLTLGIKYRQQHRLDS